MKTWFSGSACQDLRRISDRSVRAELTYIGQRELRAPESNSSIEGPLRDYPDIWWRRGVRRANLADFEGWETDDDADDDVWQPFNYVLLYRPATGDEIIDLHMVVSVDTTPSLAKLTRRATDALVIVKIWDNTVVANHFDQLR